MNPQPAPNFLMDADSSNAASIRQSLLAQAARGVGERLRSKADADDLVQETYLAALSTPATSQATSSEQYFHWLRSILNSRVQQFVSRYFRCASRDVRRERVSTPSSNSNPDGPAIASDLTSPSQAAARVELLHVVSLALGKLPEHYRQVLVLRTMEGLPFPVVAEKMNRSPQAVIMLWTRAVVAFREVLPAECAAAYLQ